MKALNLTDTEGDTLIIMCDHFIDSLDRIIEARECVPIVWSSCKISNVAIHRIKDKILDCKT